MSEVSCSLGVDGADNVQAALILRSPLISGEATKLADGLIAYTSSDGTVVPFDDETAIQVSSPTLGQQATLEAARLLAPAWLEDKVPVFDTSLGLDVRDGTWICPLLPTAAVADALRSAAARTKAGGQPEDFDAVARVAGANNCEYRSPEMGLTLVMEDIQYRNDECGRTEREICFTKEPSARSSVVPRLIVTRYLFDGQQVDVAESDIAPLLDALPDTFPERVTDGTLDPRGPQQLEGDAPVWASCDDGAPVRAARSASVTFVECQSGDVWGEYEGQRFAGELDPQSCLHDGDAAVYGCWNPRAPISHLVVSTPDEFSAFQEITREHVTVIWVAEAYTS